MDRDETLHTTVYMLCDGLIGVIEEGQALLEGATETRAFRGDLSGGDVARAVRGLGDFVTHMRTHEALLVTRLAQAREWALRLRSQSPALRPIIDLFRTVSQDAADICALLGEDDASLFNGSRGARAFIASRKLTVVASDDLAAPQVIEANAGYLLGGKLPLTPLLEMVESLLTTIELHHPEFWVTADGEVTPPAEPAEIVELRQRA